MIDPTLPNQWQARADGAATTAVTLTKTGKADHRYYITQFEVIVLGAAQAATPVSVEVQDGTTAIFKTAIKASAPIGDGLQRDFNPPLECAVGANARVVTGTPGTGVTLSVQMRGYMKRTRQ